MLEIAMDTQDAKTPLVATPLRETVVPEPEVVDDAMAAVLREKTEAQRLQIAFDLWAFARSVILQRVGAEHPDWNPAAVERETARRMSHGAV